MIPRWIIIDADANIQLCERCGAIEKLPQMPISIDEFIKWSEYFGEKHKNCKEEA